MCPNNEPVYEYPLNTIFAMSVLAPMLGVATVVAEEFANLIKTRINSGTQQRQVEDKLAHIELASEEATIAIMRQALLDDSDFILNALRAGQTLPSKQKAAIRMRLAIAARLALTSAQKMFSAMGGSLLPHGSRAERLFRDLHAMSTHFLLQPEAIGEAYGRLLLGLELPPGARL